MAEIRGRIEALARASSDRTAIQPWMRATARFHTLMRGALCAKRWLSGRKKTDASAQEAFEAHVHTFRFATEAREWAGDLPRLAQPPRGRVAELVFERIARELGIPVTEARHLVFGLSRRERRAAES
jgi:hypothetical protein